MVFIFEQHDRLSFIALESNKRENFKKQNKNKLSMFGYAQFYSRKTFLEIKHANKQN